LRYILDSALPGLHYRSECGRLGGVAKFTNYTVYWKIRAQQTLLIVDNRMVIAPLRHRLIPAAQHKAINKHARNTNHIERFNSTLRQRVSQLVRSTLAFSKKVENHIGVIQYFICHYNLTRAA